jgi:hypothetical protein
MIYLDAIFQVPSSSGSLVTAIKTEAKYRFHAGHFFTLYKKLPLQKLHILLKLCCHTLY